MSDDLYARLHAAITARLEVARAAEKLDWFAYQVATGTRAEKDDTLASFLLIHDPADAIRRYERDLKVVNRHKPDPDTFRCFWCMEWCECPDDRLVQDCPCRGNQPWPCDEIRDLLDVYSEATR